MTSFKKIIQTKFIGPTNSRGARIKAIDDNDNSIVRNYDHALSIEDNHRICANWLIRKITDKYRTAEDSYTEMTIDGMGSFGPGYIFTASRKEFTHVRQPGYDSDGQPSEQS
jgi:hypothetical protein